MKILILGMSLLFSLSSFAASKGGSGSSGKFKIKAYYGKVWTKPSNLNSYATSQAGNPTMNSITNGTLMGGEFNYRIGSRFEIGLGFDQQTYSSPQNITSPTVSGAGWTLTQNEIWLLGNFYLINAPKTFLYVGAGLGTPSLSKASFKYSTTTEYTPESAIGARGHLGFGYNFGKHVALYTEGGYQSISSGDVKTSSGSALTLNGNKVKMNLSGLRALVGLAFMF